MCFLNVFSHYTMGNHLYNYFTEKLGATLDRGTFIRWNIMPDIAPSLLKLSHFKKDIYDLVMARADDLTANKDQMSIKEFSKQLGILCHFMSDFFCYAHAEYFPGSKIGHLKYELQMQFYSYRNTGIFDAIELISQAAEIEHGLALYEQINELHEHYRLQAPSYAVDFKYSFAACVDLLNGMEQIFALQNG